MNTVFFVIKTHPQTHTHIHTHTQPSLFHLLLYQKIIIYLGPLNNTALMKKKSVSLHLQSYITYQNIEVFLKNKWHWTLRKERERVSS